jgi:HrpA-like RNA helicase
MGFIKRSWDSCAELTGQRNLWLRNWSVGWNLSVCCMQSLSGEAEKTNSPGYTHIILDEVHERTTELDLLALKLKRLLRTNPAVRLVVMSATLQASLFGPYFWQQGDKVQPPPALFVGARRFAVQELYLDDVAHRGAQLGFSVDACKTAKMLLKAMEAAVKEGAGLKGTSRERQERVLRDRQQNVQSLALSATESLIEPAGCVLVFLPGLAEITEMMEALQKKLTPKGKTAMMVRGLTIVLHVLHSLVPQDEQEAALQVRVDYTRRTTIEPHTYRLHATHKKLETPSS